MQRRPRQNHTPAFKAEGGACSLKDDQTLAQLAEQFDVHPNQITSWKAQLESGAADVFGPGGGNGHDGAYSTRAQEFGNRGQQVDGEYEQVNHRAGR